MADTTLRNARPNRPAHSPPLPITGLGTACQAQCTQTHCVRTTQWRSVPRSPSRACAQVSPPQPPSHFLHPRSFSRLKRVIRRTAGSAVEHLWTSSRPRLGQIRPRANTSARTVPPPTRPPDLTSDSAQIAAASATGEADDASRRLTQAPANTMPSCSPKSLVSSTKSPNFSTPTPLSERPSRGLKCVSFQLTPDLADGADRWFARPTNDDSQRRGCHAMPSSRSVETPRTARSPSR